MALSSTHPDTSLRLFQSESLPLKAQRTMQTRLDAFDEVTGNPYNSHTLKLEPLGDAVWGTESLFLL